jgi:hypothetical protein
MGYNYDDSFFGAPEEDTHKKDDVRSSTANKSN